MLYMMISCQYSFCASAGPGQLSCDRNSGKQFCTKVQRVVDLHQILAGSVVTFLEPLLNCQCRFKFWGCSYT